MYVRCIFTSCISNPCASLSYANTRSNAVLVWVLAVVARDVYVQLAEGLKQSDRSLMYHKLILSLRLGMSERCSDHCSFSSFLMAPRCIERALLRIWRTLLHASFVRSFCSRLPFNPDLTTLLHVCSVTLDRCSNFFCALERASTKFAVCHGFLYATCCMFSILS